MFSFRPEIEAALARGEVDSGTAGQLLAIEDRAIFSIAPEVRTVTWLGVLLLVSGVGTVLAKNLNRIGPVAIAIAIGLAAAACYAWCYARRRRESVLNDYVLLLGALLLSTEVPWLETQFHLLGRAWPYYLLILAVVHGATAYGFESKMVLSLSVGSLAGWLGIQRNVDSFFNSGPNVAVRSMVCGVLLLMWRECDRRLTDKGYFSTALLHYAANFLAWGALILTFTDYWLIGALLTLVIAAGLFWVAFRRNEEPFLLYGYLYALIAVDRIVIGLLPSGDAREILGTFYLVLSTIAAIVGLFLLHSRFSERQR